MFNPIIWVKGTQIPYHTFVTRNATHIATFFFRTKNPFCIHQQNAASNNTLFHFTKHV
jgi:hypothetical protein